MEALYRLIMSKAPLFLPDATCIGSFSTYSFAGVALPEYELQYWLKRCKRNIGRLAVNCTDGLCSISSFFRCSLFCCIFEFLCRFSPCLIKVALLSLKMEAVINSQLHAHITYVNLTLAHWYVARWQGAD